MALGGEPNSVPPVAACRSLPQPPATVAVLVAGPPVCGPSPLYNFTAHLASHYILQFILPAHLMSTARGLVKQCRLST